MKFGFESEGHAQPGTTHYHRYMELIDEVLLAEKVGWDYFGTSEQHFAIQGATVSAPEVLYPYLMAKTSRIRFAHTIVLMPYRFNHPLRVAERIATEDILSNGRVELGMGRGNTTLELRAFEVSPTENKAQLEEGIDLVRAAFLDDPFSFVGDFFKVPPRSLVPKPVQQPHPPMWVAASGPASLRTAATKGIGVVTTSNFLGFEFLRNALAIYNEAFESTDHQRPTTPKRGVLLFGMHCAESNEEAREDAVAQVEYAKLATDAYARLANLSPDYAYMSSIKEVPLDDVDYMLDESACLLAGDPDEIIKQIKRYEELGYEELWFRVDSLPHEKLMKSLELFGKYVIPHFKAPSTIVRSADDVLEEIRAMRPQHEAALKSFAERATDGQAPAGVGQAS